jgi:hypothetical protein
MDDIRISTALPHHPKMKRLEQKLGASGFSAFIKLLCWVGDNRPDGILRGLTDEDLELAVNWSGSKSLIKVLIEVGFIDGKAKCRSIHDWITHQPYVATRPQRIEKARAAAMARWTHVAPDERSKQAKKAAEARWHEPSDASGMHAPSTHKPDNSKENAIHEQQGDSCAEQVECVPSPLPFSSPSTHAPHAPSCSISSQQEVTRESHHHHPSTLTADDDDRALSSPQQTEVEKYNSRVDQFREQVLTQFRGRVDQDQEFLNAALDLIDQRAWDKRTRIVSAKYFVTALENFLSDESAVADLKQKLLQGSARRERFMPDFNEKDYSTEPAVPADKFAEMVRFAVTESERTGRNGNEILAEQVAAWKTAS